MRTCKRLALAVALVLACSILAVPAAAADMKIRGTLGAIWTCNGIDQYQVQGDYMISANWTVDGDGKAHLEYQQVTNLPGTNLATGEEVRLKFNIHNGIKVDPGTTEYTEVYNIKAQVVTKGGGRDVAIHLVYTWTWNWETNEVELKYHRIEWVC